MSEDGICIVGMGEVKVGSQNDVLKATLGSCIGIAFLWASQHRYGLAHCLLPAEPEQDMRISARYVDRGILSLLRLMGIRKRDYPEIEVVVTGGARMYCHEHDGKHVGRLNAEAAKRCLRQYGLAVKRSETGGQLGRQIVIHCKEAAVTITELSPQQPEPHHATA